MLPTALFASFVSITLEAPVVVLGLLEGLADGLAGLARFAGGALADDASRRRTVALGGYSLTALLAALMYVPPPRNPTTHSKPGARSPNTGSDWPLHWLQQCSVFRSHRIVASFWGDGRLPL